MLVARGAYKAFKDKTIELRIQANNTTLRVGSSSFCKHLLALEGKLLARHGLLLRSGAQLQPVQAVLEDGFPVVNVKHPR